MVGGLALSTHRSSSMPRTRAFVVAPVATFTIATVALGTAAPEASVMSLAADEDAQIRQAVEAIDDEAGLI